MDLLLAGLPGLIAAPVIPAPIMSARAACDLAVLSPRIMGDVVAEVGEWS